MLNVLLEGTQDTKATRRVAAETFLRGKSEMQFPNYFRLESS